MRITINNRTYESEVAIGKADQNGILEDEVTPIMWQTIHEMTITNHMFDPIPTLVLTCNDIGMFGLSKYRADGYTVILLGLTELSKFAETPENKIVHMFLLDSITPSEARDVTNTVVECRCVSISYINLMSHPDYSSGHNARPATEHIMNIAKAANLNVVNIGDVDTDRKLPYITYMNSTVMSTINDLLEKSTSPESGLFYFHYNMVRDQYNLTSMNTLYGNILDLYDDVPRYNKLTIPSESGGNSDTNVAYDVSFINNIDGTEFIEFAGDIEHNPHNYVNREWEPSVTTFKNISKTLPKYYSTYSTFTKQIYKETPEYATKHTLNLTSSDMDGRSTLHKRADEIFKYSDNITFKVLGDLRREVGQMITLEDAANGGRMGGLYLIAKRAMTIKNDTHIDEIIAIRTDMQKGGF